MLYTGKGDKGTTKLFNTPQGVRVPKTDSVFDALGTVDELVAHLGIIKVTVSEKNFIVRSINVSDIIHNVQETLFILQAELAGSNLSIPAQKTSEISEIIDEVEKELPPIKTFFIAGGTQTAAQFDVCRTITRRMERELLRALKDGVKISDSSLSYVNRLSSLMYAFARLYNHFSGITETPPSYN